MENRRILISGGGIAGLTLAFWLRRQGFEPTVVDAAPRPRGGGYMIDFWDPGFEVVERMGILEQVRAAHYDIPVLGFVDERSRVGSRVPIRKMRKMIGWRHFNLLRGDLERILQEQVHGHVDVRFSTSIVALRPGEGDVELEFAGGGRETFDLVIGADGLRSNTRRLAFAPDDRFERFLGYDVASFTVENFASSFVPASRLGIFICDALVGLTFLPFVSRMLIKRFISDELRLADYGAAGRPGT